MPVDPHLLLGFLATIVVVCIVPGPDQLFIISQGIRGGPRAGAAAAFGMTGGMLFHTVAAVAGLSALIRSSATAFELIRWAGAAYLLWLALTTVRNSRHRSPRPPRGTGTSLRSIAKQAALTNVLNPKIIVFYVAFLPQFINRSSGAVAAQLLILSLVFLVVGLLVDLAIGLSAGRLGTFLTRSARVRRLIERVSALVFVSLAARLITDRS